MKFAIFCDFDGTITSDETFVKMLRTFAPEPAARIMPKIHRFETTLREGVSEMIASIPSERLADAESCADHVPLRHGFPEFVSWCVRNAVPLVIVSGGLEGMVRRKLAPYAVDLGGIFALSVDASGPRLRVGLDLADDEELVAKVHVMRRFPADEQVAIGDSTTDVRMSEYADVVFARDRLCAQLDERGVRYHRWDTFDDIRRALADRWGLDESP